MEQTTIKASIADFNRRYPFINIQIQEMTGVENHQRLLLEIKSSTAREWDVVMPADDIRDEYLPHLMKVDILGMAQHGVLQIPPSMIDSIQRNIMAPHSRFSVTAYNKNLLPASQVPKSWEDLLKPEFKGRKFAMDIRPTHIAVLVPSWGLERTLDFTRKMAAQQPIWVRGSTRTFPSILTGEVLMMVGPSFHTVKGAQAKDRAGVLQYVNLEPVPLRLAVQQAILNTSPNPYAALLWLEWLATPEAQKIADEYEPLASSVYAQGSAVEKELRGKKLSVLGWNDYGMMEQWQKKVVEAAGFPKPEK
jgi:ABC-type Fe3+ transport system substrate-binding protein